MATRVDTVAGPFGDVAIEWVYPGAESLTWMCDFEHFSRPVVPLERWFDAHAGGGIDRAWSELDLVPPNVFVRWQFVGPYLYACDSPTAPDRRALHDAGFARLMQRYGNALRFWQEYCEPRISATCARFESAADDPCQSFEALADSWGYAWHQTFTSNSALDHFLDPLIDMLDEAIGPQGILVAHELTQGGGNASQDVDAEVWELARVLERAGAQSDEFTQRFDRLVQRHGGRASGWAFDDPTWCEQPAAVLALVRAQVAGGVSPAQQLATSQARREAALVEALAALPAAQHQRCMDLIAGLEDHVRVREDRALWQMNLTGQTRRLALRVGARLQAAGRVERADDVLFLEPHEWAESPGPLQELVAARRSEYQAWAAITPPRQIGVLDDPAPSPSASASAPAAPGSLRGVAASRGVATGPARILLDIDDWDRMEPGDVLVCPMTSPAWTSLFALAAAVVTESGNVFAHPAITAREYGIPAVLAVEAACRLIADGQQVTVDGTNGLVHLSSRPSSRNN